MYKAIVDFFKTYFGKTPQADKFWSDILKRPSLNFLVFQFANILWFCFLFSISNWAMTVLPKYIKEPPTDISSISSFIFSILDSINTWGYIALMLFISVPTTIALIEYLIKKNKLSNSNLFNKKEFIINTIIYTPFNVFFIYIFDNITHGYGIYIVFFGPFITALILPFTVLLPFLVIFIVEQIKSARYAEIPYVKNTVNIYKLIPFAIIIYTLFAALIWLVIPIYMR